MRAENTLTFCTVAGCVGSPDDGQDTCPRCGSRTRSYVAVDALTSDAAVEALAAVIENRCGLVRGIGPAVREGITAAIEAAQTTTKETPHG